MPLVSVIVPNYNHAPYLRQRLDSIFNQTFHDFEVIILDDCSTDNSIEIIEEYRNRPQVSHVVYNETNSGSPFKQWAKGFDLAQGEYIWIAESDDWAEPLFLEELVGSLTRDESLAIAFCGNYWEYSDKILEELLLPKDCFFKGKKFITSKQIFYNNIANASSVLFRKKFLTFVPDEYKNFAASGDYFFWNSICEKGNLYYKAKLLNHFRRHASSTTKKSAASGKSFFENYRIYCYLKNKGFVSLLAKYRIVCYELEEIEKYKDGLIQNKAYNQSKKQWEKEVIAKCFVTKIMLYYAKQLNKYDALPPITKFWKIFHLPNPDIRGFFLKLLH